MEIRTFAENVLFGSTWEEKLLEPNHLEDRDPGRAIATPSSPGRPQGLSLDGWHNRAKVRFADVRTLRTERERGLALHFFANHELLALELMALALLKFPAAPPKFRRGLVRTLMDEQQHLRLYRSRMREVGVEFGEIPVSDFFWKSISTMKRPFDLVARLSLTLEQANLDYSLHYARSYHQLGDEKTSGLLKRIYQDEIGHVKHGLLWFNRWRNPDLSEWEAYNRTLSRPLTPSRAKGIGFNRDGRRKAGLSAAFVDELELYTRSKGRCPGIYWFNPNCEAQFAFNRTGWTPTKLPLQLAADYAALPMFLCAPDDVVLVERRPSSNFLRKMQGAGFSIPEFAEYGNGDLEKLEIADRKISRLRPWGWSPDSVRFMSPLVENLATGKVKAEAEHWNEEKRRLYSKAWSTEVLRQFLLAHGADDDWLCDEWTVGKACTSREDAMDHVEQLHTEGAEKVVIKAIFGASGQNQIHLTKGRMRQTQARWMLNILAKQGCVVVEPFLDKVFDLSLHLDINAHGAAQIAGSSRFLTDTRGQYRGSFVARMVDGLDIEARKFLYANNRDTHRLQKLAESLADHTSACMADTGYFGPVGIDALVYHDGERLRLKPIVEINPRFTMGRVALHLSRRVNSARTALWLILTRKEICAAGFTDIAAFAEYMEKAYPVEIEGNQLSKGILFTTDPTQAREFASALLIGESLEACQTYFAEFPGKLSAWTRLCNP